MEFDMHLRLREMMSSRLDDAVGDMHFRVSTDPMAQLVRALCETCMWLLKDWPNQKIDNHETVRASRMDTLGRLRQLLRVKPPKNSEMDGLILLLSDALLTISEQWPGGESDIPGKFVQQQQQPLRLQSSQPTAASPAASAAATSVHIPPMYSVQGSACKPPAPKLPRLQQKPWTVDGFQQPSTPHSSSFPPATNTVPRPINMKPAGNAGQPSALWAFFTKATNESGQLFGKCMMCGKMVIRHNHGTSGMKAHLRTHHPAEFASLGMDSSTSSETSQASPPVVEPEAPQRVSAILAALNGDPSLPDMGNSPRMYDDIVKDEPEDMEYDETLAQSMSESFEDEPGPSSNQFATVGGALTQRRNGSDIWTYFKRVDIGTEKHGSCLLCNNWSKKMYNYGTNNMWTHLKKVHPEEYTILKPYEYNPAVHGQFNPETTPAEANQLRESEERSEHGP